MKEMEILKMILIYMLTPILARWIANGFTYKWDWPYPFRKKYKWLNSKPWSCTTCLTTWICAFTFYCILNSSILLLLLNLIMCFIVYVVVECIEDNNE